MNWTKSRKRTKTWQGHTGLVLDSVKDFDVIDCEACGFKHIIPIPTAEEMEKVYREEYYSVKKPLYLERIKEDLDWWNIVYNERYEIFEELLPPHRRRILDVGSGPGFFLLHGKRRGWQTLGIEPSRQAAAYSRQLGLKIVEDFLTERTADQLGTFDVVHMHEVLEHIPDPRGMLQLVRDLLTPRGLICIGVPNDYNPFQYALRTVCGFEPWWVTPPHHINYFNSSSLSQLLSRSGFDIILREATFPIDMFLLMGDNYVDDDMFGRQCHGKRKRLEQNLDQAGLGVLKRRLYQILAEQDIGREIIVYAHVTHFCLKDVC